MKKFRVITAFILMGLCSFLGSEALAQEHDWVKTFAEEHVKEKAKASGTLDIFDESIDSVRNLRFLEFMEGIDKEGDQIVLSSKFRDIASGDVVTVNFFVTDQLEARKMFDIKIVGVQKFKAVIDPDKEYSDDDIKQAIHAYINSQTKFTEHLLLFDQDANKLRKLDLVALQDEVRKFGKLSIVTAAFKDVESNENLKVDITVKNDEGVLSIDTLRIRDVSP